MDMNRSDIPRLAGGIHRDSAQAGGGGRSRRRGSAFGEPVILDRLFPRDRVGLLRGICCLLCLTAVVLGGILAVTLLGRGQAAGGSGGDGGDGRPGGIPSEDTRWEGTVSGETPGGTPDGTTGGTPGGIPGEISTGEETRGLTEAEGTREEEPGETGPDSGETNPAEGGSQGPLSPTDSDPAETETREPGGQPDGEEESAPDGTADSESDDPSAPSGQPSGDPSDEPETKPTVPEGCYPSVSLDMSRTERGAGYIEGETEGLPIALPDMPLWGSGGRPAVLIVNTHPYEGYGDGKAWYDPESGPLASTDTANAADGTVALGASLGRTLRGMGLTVMHLRVAVSEGDTAADIYSRTETLIRSYCRLYPDIGLVLNLRRSAELTEEGGILRTLGMLDGERCAQLRISVNGGREEEAVQRDLAVALALRGALWDTEPTVSRPVRVKAGSGMIGELSQVCVLTLEMGSAGNVYEEAARLIDPLAGAVASVLGG